MTIEVPVIEGLLSFDGRVLELFRTDGRQGAWRLHAGLITAIGQDRRQDRVELRFHTTAAFYESAQVLSADEGRAHEIIRALDANRPG